MVLSDRLRFSTTTSRLFSKVGIKELDNLLILELSLTILLLLAVIEAYDFLSQMMSYISSIFVLMLLVHTYWFVPMTPFIELHESHSNLKLQELMIATAC